MTTENVLNDYLYKITQNVFATATKNNEQLKIRSLVQKQYINHLSALTANKNIDQQVSAMARYQLNLIKRNYLSSSAGNPYLAGHKEYLSHFIDEVLDVCTTTSIARLS